MSFSIVVHDVLVCVAAVRLIVVGEIKAHGFDLLIGQSQLIVKHSVEFLTSVMLREESYEPILNSVGACRWKMVCQGIQALPQAAGPVVIFQPYSPIVQINDRPLFRSPAMTKVMDQGICFIRKRPPERSAALRGGSGKCLRKAAVPSFRDSRGPRQQGVQFRKPIPIFIYKGSMTPLFHYLIQHRHGVHFLLRSLHRYAAYLFHRLILIFIV